MLVKHTQFLEWLAAGSQSTSLSTLLEEDRYDLAAEQLSLLLPVDDPTANLLLAHAALVLRGTCAALHQCQRELEWYQWALQNVKTRQTELRTGLYSLLEVADDVVRKQSHGLNSHTLNANKLLLEAGQVRSSTATGDRLSVMPRLLRRARALQRRTTAEVIPVQYDLMVYGLGGFEVYLGETLIDEWSSRRGAAVFKYLLLNRGRPVHKEKLLEVLWADADEGASLDRLNGAIYSLRQTLRRGDSGSHIIRFENDHYRLNPELRIWTDFEQFMSDVSRGQQAEHLGKMRDAINAYEAAALVYRGPLFAEYPYLEWVELERQQLQSRFLSVMDRLSEHYLASGDHLSCQTACQRMLTVEPTCERAYTRLMRLYARSGQLQLAQQQYQLCVHALRTHGLQPAQETAVLYGQVRRGEAV